MKYDVTGSICTRTTVAILAAVGMLWIGSTQGLNAQTDRSDAAEVFTLHGLLSCCCRWRVGIHRNRLGHPFECRRSLCGRREVYPGRGRKSFGDSYE